MLYQMLELAGLDVAKLSMLTGKRVEQVSRWASGKTPVPQYVYTIIETWPCVNAMVKARMLKAYTPRAGKGRRTNEDVWALAAALSEDAKRIFVENPGFSLSRWALADALSKREGCMVSAQQIYKRYMDVIIKDHEKYYNFDTDRFQYKR